MLLVTIFVLLEHESLRDRFIRIAGASDIRAMTLALNDASERLSRYFVSQTCVNLAFGVAIWAGLKLLGVPQAMLWGTLAGLTRFVPYVGVATVALFATALSFAVDSGWSLAVSTLALFILLDIVAAQLAGAAPIRPHHGLVAARSRSGSHIVELALGAGGLGSVDAADFVPSGGRTTHQGV